MKSPEYWSQLYFKDKVRNLPDLIKQVQNEAWVESIDAINQAFTQLKARKPPSPNPKCSICRDTGWFFTPYFGGGGIDNKCSCGA